MESIWCFCGCACILFMSDHGSIKAIRTVQWSSASRGKTQSPLHPRNTGRYILVFIIDLSLDMIHVFPFTCQILCSQTQYWSNKRLSGIHCCFSPPANTNVSVQPCRSCRAVWQCAALGTCCVFLCARGRGALALEGMCVFYERGGGVDWLLLTSSLANKDE